MLGHTNRGLSNRWLDNQQAPRVAIHMSIHRFHTHVYTQVLDDNKLFTLPNGERLALPPSVRIIFEVQDLKYATLATVSRCGMTWFSSSVLPIPAVLKHHLKSLENLAIDNVEEGDLGTAGVLNVQARCAEALEPHFAKGGTVEQALNKASTLFHVMDFTDHRALRAFFGLLDRGIAAIVDYNNTHSDFPLSNEMMGKFICKHMVWSLLWGFGGSLSLDNREVLGNYLSTFSTLDLPGGAEPLIDWEVKVEDASWSLYKSRVPQIEIETHKVPASDVLITTVDTIRHEQLLYSWLASRRPVVLCGPPGSGKTMTMMATMRALPEAELVQVT